MVEHDEAMTAQIADPSRTGAVERRTGVALWRQIADRLREQIASGSFDETGRLPPELEVAARFGVNRHTVREAIAALVREGVLRSEQGRGTFIQQGRHFLYPIGTKTRFVAGLEGQAQRRRGLLLGHAYETADAETAEALSLAPDAPVLRMETLGVADGAPVSRATTYFDALRFNGLERVYAETGSVTASFATHGLGDYSRRSTVISARHANAQEISDLRLSPGAIVLVTTAINVDPQGMPVQFSRTRFPASSVELSVTGTD